MRIAYLILIHRNPVLLRRVIATLSTKHCGFFIHVDRKADVSPFSAAQGENVFLSARRLPVYWGEYSQVEATLLLIEQAMAALPAYDRFVFLQGSDYPLRSGRYVEEFFAANKDWEFVSLVRMPAPGYPLSKINRLRYPSSKPFLNFTSRVLGKLGFAQRDYRRHLAGLDAYAGQACWALSREACEYVLQFADKNPHVARYFQNTFTADEMYFHTILGNSSFRPRIRRNLVYLDWSAGSDHPISLGGKHVSLFEAREKVWVEDEWGSGEVLFARKFSDDELSMVDRIDRMIREKERDSFRPAIQS